MKKVLLLLMLPCILVSCKKENKQTDTHIYLQNPGGDSVFFTLYNDYYTYYSNIAPLITIGVAPGQKTQVPIYTTGRNYYVDWHNSNYQLNNWRLKAYYWKTDSFQTYSRQSTLQEPFLNILFNGYGVTSEWISTTSVKLIL